MSTQQTKRVIVVLSPGRCGTSLLMKALGAMGMVLSENIIHGSVTNPEGFFEDADIVETQKKLLAELDALPTLPLPDGWLEASATRNAKTELLSILEKRVSSSLSIWGFKDPRTASFLPLWYRVFNALSIVPVFLFAIRNPTSVAASLKVQINRDEALSELQWLVRTVDSLHFTGADCFIVHYEDWFSRPVLLAQELLDYTGLSHDFDGNIEDLLKGVIKSNLKRCGYEGHKVKNEYVSKLYDALSQCRGADFDHHQLMSVVYECRKAMDGFKGWYQEAHKYVEISVRRKERCLKLEAKKDLLTPDLQKDLQIMTLQNNTYLKEIKELSDDIQELRKASICNLKQIKELSGVVQDQHNASICNQSRVKQGCRAVEEKEFLYLSSVMWRLEDTYHSVRNSARWRIGNSLVRFVSLCLFKRRQLMPLDHIKTLFREYKNEMIVFEPTKKDLKRISKKIEKLRKHFSNLFMSTRWKVGDKFISFVRAILFKEKLPTPEYYVGKIFAEFDKTKKIV